MKSISKLLLVIFAITIISCDKQAANPYDFRDQYMGTYNCLYTRNNPVIDGDYMIWITDTAGNYAEISIKKSPANDSTLTVILESDSFNVNYDKNYDQFTCEEYSGPPNYAKFFAEDSVHIFIKTGVASSDNYYGRKH